VFPDLPEFAYLTESTGRPRVDALFDRLRDRGSGGAARRKHGALALRKALEDGRSATLLVDRNVRRRLGGRWLPFLGLPSRTTPLAGVLARQCGVPLVVLVLIPEGRGRWRLWASPDLTGPDTDDADADAMATMTRVNDVLSRLIRERPDAWAWMLKRWKSRPTPEIGPYPTYSLYDPD
jgi:KDO2-lipid IV(A) lauroyltransferase